MAMCYMCDGKGERNYGMVAEGIYPNVETYYKGMDTCDTCNGTGELWKGMPLIEENINKENS